MADKIAFIFPVLDEFNYSMSQSVVIVALYSVLHHHYHMVTTRSYCSHSCSCFLSGKWNKRILLWEGGLTGKEITLIASSIYSPFKRIHIPLLDPPSVTTPLSIYQHVILISHIEEIDDTESWSRFQMHMKSREFISLLITCLVSSFIHKSIKALQDRDNRQEPSLFYQFFVVVLLSSTRKEATKASNKQCKQTNKQMNNHRLEWISWGSPSPFVIIIQNNCIPSPTNLLPLLVVHLANVWQGNKRRWQIIPSK